MRIKKKFLQLTKNTYPFGTESQLERWLPKPYIKDTFGNYIVLVGESTTMFTCHLDTVCKQQQAVNHRFRNNFILTDGTTTLGADDKAGMIVLLYMIEKKIPGIYAFFIGEESGCLGSRDLSSDMNSGYYFLPELKKINKVISFDRKGTNSIITEQLFNTCCSEQFAQELANRLNNTHTGLTMRLDDTGVSTDSAQFMDFIPECTNISVGYYDEHTVSERQDIAFLYRLCKAVVSIDWETLPVLRDPHASYIYRPYSTKSNKSNGWCNSGLDDWDAPWDNSPTVYTIPKDVFEDRFDKQFYTFRIDPKDNKRKVAYISKVWVYHEHYLISNALTKQGRNIKTLTWDGTTCWLLEKGHSVMEYIGGRNDVAIYLEKLGYIPLHHLIYEDEVSGYKKNTDSNRSNQLALWD